MMRNSEMVFLGMDRASQQPVKKKEDIWGDFDDPLGFMQQTQETRRQARVEIAHLFEKERIQLEDEIRKVEAEDIWESEYRKRQNWIQEYKELHNGKPPDKIDKYDDGSKKEAKVEEVKRPV